MRASAAIFALLILFVHSSRAQYVPPEALVEPLKPIGIRISIPDESGISLVAFHVKFNEDFMGLEAGTIARDIVRAKNDRWTYEDRSTRLKHGDVIYYWIHIIYNGLGYDLLDQKQRVTEFFDYSGKKVEDGSNNNDNVGGRPCVSSGTKVFDSSGSSRYPCAGQLLFEENFRDLDQFKRSKWTIVEQFSSKPDYEFVLYHDAEENIKIDNKLKIIPLLITDDDVVRRGSVTVEKCTGRIGTNDCIRDARGYNIIPPVQSARINTKKAINFQYGRVEIKAKLPKGDWVYPLLMLEPVKGADSSSGSSLQIRVASSAGNAYLRANDRDISGHILWGGVINSNELNIYEDRINQQRSTKFNENLWSEDFHVFELSWSKAKMILKVDGLRYDEFRNLEAIPEDTPFYLTLGVAVGGVAEFPDKSVSNGYNKTWLNTDPKALLNFYNSKDKWHRSWDDSTALSVEYVKIWAL